MKWGDNKRDFDPVLAVWPRPNRATDTWWMQELIEQQDGSVKWRDRRIPTDAGHVRLDIHRTNDAAQTETVALNARYAAELEARDLEPVKKRSLQLKVAKALQAKERLQAEEALMLDQAKARHASTPRPTRSEIELHPASEELREELFAKLQDMPYLNVALVGSPRRALFREKGQSWTKPYYVEARKASLLARAEIANGFGFHHGAHWGETKAAIRQILLPRANQLLQLASVKRMLAEALARGERALVSGPYIFWYEPDGRIGWQVKLTHDSGREGGSTLWKEGTILSKNHGRLVILPYIKEDGERVRGHTRNAPRDGPAKPRHSDDFVEIPFRQLDGDLMIGLMGELPYE